MRYFHSAGTDNTTSTGGYMYEWDTATRWPYSFRTPIRPKKRKKWCAGKFELILEEVE